ncbi:MAG: tail fiber protein [Pseudomonadota bacterium]
MPEPVIGEIRAFGFGFAPRGWAACDGQLLPIKANEALYALIGATYGGDGKTNFALPDLRGRMPIGVDGRSPDLGLGAKGGDEAVILSVATMPAHGHGLRGSASTGTEIVASGNAFAALENGYDPKPAAMIGIADVVEETGLGGGHKNMQPFLALQLCIAVQGQYPSRS